MKISELLNLARENKLVVPRRVRRKKSLLLEFLLESGVLGKEGSGVGSLRASVPVETLVDETVSVPRDGAPGLVQRTLERVSGWMNWLGSAGNKIVSAVRSGIGRLRD